MHADCPADAVLERFALGLEAGPDADRLEDHVGDCAPCAARLRTLGAEDALVRSVRAAPSLPRPALPGLMEALTPLLKCLRPPDSTGQFHPVSTDTAAPGGALPLPEDPTEPGGDTQLGPYQILAVLGTGGMGVVYRAYDPRLDREVALKVIKPELAARPGLTERFLSEARAVAAVEHDNIVALYHADEVGGVPYLTMPLLRGESLERRLEDAAGPLPADEVLRVGREVAQGLAAAHEKGLIHRDIKPPNLWVEEGTARVKILDFGLAEALGPAGGGSVAAVAGTPAYMAPEQAEGRPLDGRADLFSLGCVLYRAATGEVPFTGADTMSILFSVVADVPKAPRAINPRLPAVLEELILDLLAKKPEGRPASAREVVDRVAAIERRRAEAARSWWTRRAWLVTGAAGLAAGLGLWAWRGNRPGDGPDERPADVTFDCDDPDASLLLRRGDTEVSFDPRREKTVSLPPGDYLLRPAADTGRRPVPESFRVNPGEAQTVAVTLVGEIGVNKRHGLSVLGVALAETGGRLLVLSAGVDRMVGVWEPLGKATPVLLDHGNPVRAVAARADGRRAASAGGERRAGGDFTVHLWDLETNRPAGKPLAGHDRPVTALAFDPAGRRLLSGAYGGALLLWDLAGGKAAPLAGHDDNLCGVAFSPDGRQALSADLDGRVILWDVAVPRAARTLDKAHEGGARAVAFLPGGRGFVSAGQDGALRVWTPDGDEVRRLTGHKGAVLAVAVAGDRLLSGGDDGTVRLWETATGRQLLSLEGHRRPVNGVALTADGRRAVSGGSDGTVRLWQLPR